MPTDAGGTVKNDLIEELAATEEAISKETSSTKRTELQRKVQRIKRELKKWG
ncbi:FtsZ-binding cell division protein ZapB [Rhizobium leguminosarum]|nr:FtsZ-binding cell division protein ZapB [Rhizobium leguminosarum]